MTGGNSDLPSFPMARRCPHHPPPEYAEMRVRGAAVRVNFLGTPVWAITRHAEARDLLTDSRVSTDPASPGHPFGALAATAERMAGQLTDMDPPEHSAHRRMLISEFGVRRVREMRPAIERSVDDLLDGMAAAGAADLVEAYGLPLASAIMCQLLGVPERDHAFFHDRACAMLGGVFSSRDADVARMEMLAYLDDLVRGHKPGQDGVIDRLLTIRHDTGEPTHEAIVGMCFMLLLAGHHTTATMIPLGVHTLLDHPDQLAQLRAEPALWPVAVDELLRFHSIVDWMSFDRVAIADIDVGDERIHAGEGIFVLGAAANRDERAFERPDDFNIHRRSRHHLAFGVGIHQCLGQSLARTELEISYRRLFDRFPTIRIQPPAAGLSFKYDAAMFGLQELPVTW